MKAVLLATLVATAPTTAAPRPIDWSRAQTVDVVMGDMKFTPDRIVLRRDRPYRLRLHNDGSNTHDMTAGRFWANADIPPADRAKLIGKRLKLVGGETLSVRLVPRTFGTFSFHSSGFGEKQLGMDGVFLVR